MLIDIHMKHVKEMESIRESIDETQRRIYNSNEGSGSYYRSGQARGRGYNNGGFHGRPNRFRGGRRENGDSSPRIQSPSIEHPPAPEVNNDHAPATNGNHQMNGTSTSKTPAENGRGRGGGQHFRGGFRGNRSRGNGRNRGAPMKSTTEA